MACHAYVYTIPDYSHYVWSFFLVRAFCCSHLYTLVVNTPTALDVYHGLQTFSNSRRTLASDTFDTRPQCGGIHYHLHYLMMLVIFMIVCSATFLIMTCPELFFNVVCMFVCIMCPPVWKNGYAEYRELKLIINQSVSNQDIRFYSLLKDVN